MHSQNRSTPAAAQVALSALITPLARHFFGEPNACMSSRGELRFGRYGSLSIDLRKGTWFDHEAKVGGGVIDLIKRREGFTNTRDVMAWLELEGFTHGRGRESCSARLGEREKDDVREKLRAADRIWREAVPIAGSPGAVYLGARGIDLDALPDAGGLRFHPRCPWGTGGATAPCIVARFSHAVSGEPLGIRRRRIDANDKPRSLGPTAGGVICLSPEEDVAAGLVIGEGVETVLAAMTRIEHRNTMLQPAWACGSAAMLRDLPILAGIEALTVLVDADHSEAGQNAARACAERWAAARREVTLLTPRDVGIDFNDLVRGLPPC
jgi:hypothetical protein